MLCCLDGSGAHNGSCHVGELRPLDALVWIIGAYPPCPQPHKAHSQYLNDVDFSSITMSLNAYVHLSRWESKGLMNLSYPSDSRMKNVVISTVSMAFV